MVHDASDPSNGGPFEQKTFIASGSLILVTGANGYIASHVVDQLLQLGYNVGGTASDVSFNPDPYVVIPSAIENVLICSRQRQGNHQFEGWNNESVRARAAWDPDTPSELKPVLVYSASKTEAERKAWEWVRLNKPSCGFNSVLPSMNRLLEWFGNVVDTARLHIIATLDIEVESEHLWACAAPMNWAQVIGILQNLRPSNTLIPTAPTEEPKDYTEIVRSRLALQLLRIRLDLA
ncbi:hypothetical protein PENFLA_c023G04025 [Penicillium flavigenum]|uniref:NAD-dependent epimerase/dehydratase domain-containing protein n=1 Tax=Penicillium flavigenum TaxID=254877 RepID=A0A1V6SUI5_9EURO|nr:hypothetical protein PENFLA_c023G04025 [Penicillium flavigenum]